MIGYIAIGCAPEDIGTAEIIREALKTKKIKSRVLPVDEADGTKLRRKTKRVIRKCQLFLLVYSGNSVRYNGLLKETDTAEKYGIPVLPYNSEGAEPVPPYDFYLTGSHCVSVLQDGSCNTEPICENVKQLAKEHKKEANTSSGKNLVGTLLVSLVTIIFSPVFVYLVYSLFRQLGDMSLLYKGTVKEMAFTDNNGNVGYYTGEVNQYYNPDGLGSFTYEFENGKGVYICEWDNGSSYGIVNLTFLSSKGWTAYVTGMQVNNVWQGYVQEKWVYDDGQIDTFSGEYKWGRREGEGHLVYDNICNPDYPDIKKEIYDGNFKNGYFEGYGTDTLEFYNGDIQLYEGEFDSGDITGNGKMKFTSVSEGYTETLVGYFVKAYLNGQGKRTRVYNNGDTSIYEGEFADDKPNGYVSLTMFRPDGYNFFAMGNISENEKFEDGTMFTEYDPEVGAERTGVFADGEKVYDP